MLLYTEEKLVGKNARFIYPTEAEYERVGLVKHAKISDRRVVSIETQWQRSDGAVLDIFLSSSRIPGGNDIVFTAMDITEVKRNETYLKRNEERLEALLELSKMSYLDEDAVTQYALEEGVRLTDSSIGYLHFVNGCDKDACEGDVNLNLFTWTDAVKKECKAEKLAHYPLTEAGIWADSVRKRAPVIHNDYATEADKKGLPEGHIALTRHMCVPVFEGDDIVAVAGVGNKELPYDQTDVYQLSIFMNSMWDILQRKSAERQAQQSRESLERLIAASPMGVLVYKLTEDKLKLTHFNKTAQQLLNMDGPSFIGMNIEDVFPPLAERKIVEKYTKIAKEGGLLKEPAYSYQDPAANISGVFSVFAFQSATNEIAVFFADVTEQMHAQEALRKSEEKFRVAFMTVPDPAIILEAGTGKIVAVNPATCRSSGYSEEELVGSLVTEVDLWLNIEDRDSFYTILNKYGYVNDFPIKVKTKGDKEKDGILSSRLFDLDGKPHVISIIKDVSTIMSMRQDICQSEFLYKSIMDKVYEGVFLIQNEKFVLINKPLCDILGYEEPELVDKEFIVMIAPEERERVLNNYRSRVTGKACLDKYESMLISKTGERIPVIIDASAIKYGDALASMGTITRIE
jgi:PAS domain S-box-containing protein